MDITNRIEQLAYEFYENSGRADGKDLDNWLQAEQMVLSELQKEEKQEAAKVEAPVEALVGAE